MHISVDGKKNNSGREGGEREFVKEREYVFLGAHSEKGIEFNRL